MSKWPRRRSQATPRRLKSGATSKRTFRRKSKADRRKRAGGKRRSARRPLRRAVLPIIAEKIPQEAEEQATDRYDEGYKEGLYAGGEGLLEKRLPPNLIFPDLTLEDFLAEGIAALRYRGIPILQPVDVYAELERMLTAKQPYSLVRLGDGELLTLAQEKVMTIEEVRQKGAFLVYAGIDVPDLQASEELASCIRSASLVGVPLSRSPHFQPLLFAVWRAYGIHPHTLRLTSSTVNYSLNDEGYMMRLLTGRRVLVIGDLADPLAQSLMGRGVRIAGTVSPVRGVSDFPRVVDIAAMYEFDLALVSAGIAAVPICVHLANRTGKVAIDFGHLANRITGLTGPFVRHPLPAAAIE
ncbi:GT-D fold domain-containing glycosyltransferase [Cohnella thailandensis]|uniref:Succinyl-CoA synthetase n=1 Tax=Cohnella thailandensis TaxID=557557 RepID=A0A841SU46_9BACL|nr:GT-D fold domain-containing glycosyltransferase [Cohnella thailandensis]MBB6635843.1 succinyl-CoA synthetase [Cohnella thailandensis]MBP1976221.1 hypothetical protein [Cohnella thailandensis]